MNKSESKYFNTAVRMDEALLELLEKKDFAYITVKEICEKAGVNRSTFYLHYETIGDLLAESIEYMHKKLLSYFSDSDNSVVNKLRFCPEEELFLVTSEYLTPYLTFVCQHRNIYQTAMENPRIFSADKTYQKMFRHIFDPILQRFSVSTSERNYMMLFYLNGISAIIAEWLKRNCTDSIEHIIAIIHKCVMCGKEEI